MICAFRTQGDILVVQVMILELSQRQLYVNMVMFALFLTPKQSSLYFNICLESTA